LPWCRVSPEGYVVGLDLCRRIRSTPENLIYRELKSGRG
jgi:hypothetical protein